MPEKLIGLIAHTAKPGAAPLVQTLADEFKKRGAPVKLEKRTAALVRRSQGVSTPRLGEICDILVVLGGDGTILQVVNDLGKNIKPIFGINLGSLGFLTCVNSSAYLKAVDAILARDYVLSQRTLLAVEIIRKGRIIARFTGLNDAVISRGALSRLIRLDARIDDSVLTEYNADGLIIATATGSTAYSLSAGGPILMPDSGVFVITPICPHVLTNRTVIVSDSSVIEVRPCRDQGEIFLAVDGHEPQHEVECGDIIRIHKAKYSLPLAMLREMSFSEVLRRKLKWGGSAL
ncbi:MAG TPA: NAD(+)/NADH kinase [Chthoniobacteraceae bacterium]|nr:NAD(+)/NADH kinase [Chthoniobacteraceae bacterium]